MSAKERTQDEKNLKTLRELVALPINKHCFDCRQRGPTYVNVTIGSFVCTSCSGLLRGLNPPNRVKSITMAKFTAEEIELIKNRGNEYCRYVWLGNFDSQLVEPEMQSIYRVREHMIKKYEEKIWYVDPDIAVKRLLLNEKRSSTLVQEAKTPTSFPVTQAVQNNQISWTTSLPSVSCSTVHSPGKSNAFAEFGSSTKPLTGTTASHDTFADFSSAFDNTKTTTAFTSIPSSSATLLPKKLHSPPISRCQIAFVAPSVDKYAALADLDSELHHQLTQHHLTAISSSAIPPLWSGSNTTLYGGPTVLGSHSVYGVSNKSNPFRDTTSTWSQTSLISSANPFQTTSKPLAPSHSSFFKPSVVGSQPSNTTTSLPNGDSKQVDLQNGDLGSWAVSPRTVAGWISGHQNGQLDMLHNNKMNHEVENLNLCPQENTGKPIANPFMNGTGAPELPKSGINSNPTNNPFL